MVVLLNQVTDKSLHMYGHIYRQTCWVMDKNLHMHEYGQTCWVMDTNVHMHEHRQTNLLGD